MNVRQRERELESLLQEDANRRRRFRDEVFGTVCNIPKIEPGSKNTRLFPRENPLRFPT